MTQESKTKKKKHHHKRKSKVGGFGSPLLWVAGLAALGGIAYFLARVDDVIKKLEWGFAGVSNIQLTKEGFSFILLFKFKNHNPFPIVIDKIHGTVTYGKNSDEKLFEIQMNTPQTLEVEQSITFKAPLYGKWLDFGTSALKVGKAMLGGNWHSFFARGTIFTTVKDTPYTLPFNQALRKAVD
jgi:hypothetical protein